MNWDLLFYSAIGVGVAAVGLFLLVRTGIRIHREDAFPGRYHQALQKDQDRRPSPLKAGPFHSPNAHYPDVSGEGGGFDDGGGAFGGCDSGGDFGGHDGGGD